MQSATLPRYEYQIPEPAFTPKIWRRSSIRSSRRNGKGRGWDCRLRGQSSKATVAPSGPRIASAAPCFASHCHWCVRPDVQRKPARSDQISSGNENQRRDPDRFGCHEPDRPPANGKQLFEDQTRSLPAVAELLGFSAQSALARWFRERFGQSITQWRSQSNRKFLIENLYSICSANPGITQEKSQRTDGLAVHRKG